MRLTKTAKKMKCDMAIITKTRVDVTGLAPSKYETLTRCWVIDVPSSSTLAQQWPDIGQRSHDCWVVFLGQTLPTGHTTLLRRWFNVASTSCAQWVQLDSGCIIFCHWRLSAHAQTWIIEARTRLCGEEQQISRSARTERPNLSSSQNVIHGVNRWLVCRTSISFVADCLSLPFEMKEQETRRTKARPFLASQQAQNIEPTSKTLRRRCINVILWNAVTSLGENKVT